MNSIDFWIDQIEQAGRRTLPNHEAVRTAGHSPLGRRITAGLLASRITGEPSPIQPAELSGEDNQLLAAAVGLLPVPEPRSDGGSIQAQTLDDVIELWTERELTMVHAAWLLEGWTDIAESSARWLITEIQPDNATNLPWAVHVFASLAVRDDSHEARMYAETLMHNCMVSSGQPDTLSALILLDAAKQLRTHHAG